MVHQQDDLRVQPSRFPRRGRSSAASGCIRGRERGSFACRSSRYGWSRPHRLEQAAQAHRRIESGRTTGKLVLEVERI
ncbi:zinc-binding dehydrogenase [Nonomuraea sp. 3N208]|uniref:zinc-binding dehydrogenase n=1 Tax=Nonomuraea sp. 3N208 TaxID=3457421 RepID=UPI003FCD6CFA